MKLTLKLLIVFALATLGVLAANTYVRIAREKALFDADMRKDALAQASTLAESLEVVATLPGGVERGLAVVQHANRGAPHLRLRWITLEQPASRLKLPRLPVRELGEVLHGRPTSRRLAESGGALVTYVPLRGTVPGEGRTAIELTESMREEASFVRGSKMHALAGAAGLLVIATTVSALFGAIVVGRPVGLLKLKAQRAGTGDFAGPLVLERRDELRDLARELNTMCDHLAEGRQREEEAYTARITALEQVRRADRLATVGHLAAGVAHEVGTPLGVIVGRAKMIATGETRDEEARESATIVAEQAHRIAGIIRQLLDFSRKRPPEKAWVEVAPLAQGILALLGQMAQKRGVSLTSGETPTATVRVFGDAGQLQQAVTNLVINALQATPRQGKVELSFSRVSRPPPGSASGATADWIELCVSDNGSGMNAETLEHVFEPFFTTKSVGEGTGLGLAVTHGIVEEHGGFMEVASEAGKGSRFAIYLPHASEEQA